jgi:hypothetical protein
MGRAILEEQLERIEAEIKEIKRLLTGDPNDKPGLVIRLDRVVQRVHLHDWLIFLLISIAITALFK